MNNWMDFNTAAVAPAAASLGLLFCTGRGQYDTRKNSGGDYEGITGKEIVTMLRDPPAVPKAEAQWIIPSTYRASDGRSHDAQREHGEFWFLPLDEDGEADNNLSLDEIDAAVREVCGDVTRLIYSTRSATQDKRKWRALVPLMWPIRGADYEDTVNAFNAELIEASAGVLIPDPKLERPGQLVNLPNRGALYEHRVHKRDRLELAPDHRIIRKREANRSERRAAEAEARKRRETRQRKIAADPDGAASVVEAFNNATTVAGELERFGYKRSRNGRDWRSPNSTTGSYAVRSYNGFWLSLSGSDAALEIGNTSPSGARIGDAFDLFAHYEHGGDFTAAVHAAAKAMDMDHASQRDRATAEALARIADRAPGQADSPDGQADTPLSERAQALRAAMQPLGSIAPVLSNRYLVKGWLDRGAASSIYAEPKGWKTFFMLDMAMHVAAGRDWHGHRTGEPGAVLYLAGEGGVGIRNRIEAIRQAHPDLVEAAGDNFVLLPVTVDLCGPRDVAHLASALLARDWSLIVIDTLARAMGDGDENTAKDMGAFVRNVDRLRELTKAHAAVIHHTGKDAARGARGSNALLGAVDTEIRITRDGDVAMAETTNQRDMAAGRKFTFTIEDVPLGQDEDGDAVSSAVVVETDPPEGGGKAKLSPTQRVALEALQQFVADYGEPNPGGTGWPAPGTVKCVETGAFLVFLRGKMNSDDPKSQRVLAKRALDGLTARGAVQTNGGRLWIVG